MNLDKLKNILTTYTVPGWELKRWGGNRDGGYVVFPEAVLQSDVLYTYGVGPNTKFEVEYCQKTGNPVFAFDHTVRNIPHEHESITFIKEGVSGEKRYDMDTYENHHIKYGGKHPFLKIDIEGWEYEVIKAIPNDLLKKSPIFVLEVHDLETRLDEFIELVEKINQNFVLIHLHPNNWGKTFKINEYDFPDVLELSFINKNVSPEIKKTILDLPLLGIDRKNNQRRPDILIKYLYK